MRFQAPATDLDGLLTNVREGYEGRNLAGVVLVSDGLVNQGRSPVYSEFNFPIYSVAVGDTVPKRDLSLPTLNYNRVAFSGNRFPLRPKSATKDLRAARPRCSCVRMAACWKPSA